MHEYEFLYFSLHDTQQKAAWYPPALLPCFIPHAHISSYSAASQMTPEASISGVLQKICDFCYRKKKPGTVRVGYM